MKPIAEGERWAFRKGQLPFEEATILKVVSQSGHRKVRVQFEDGPNAGESQWVGRPYLKAKWDERQAFVDREQRWAKAKSGRLGVPLGLTCAAALVITETMDDALACDRDNGILQQVSEMLQESVNTIRKHCRTQALQGAYKTGTGKTSPWRIPPAAIDHYQRTRPRQ